MKDNYTEEQNKAHIRLVLSEGQYCHLSMANNNEPYVVTVNYGFDENYIYFHSSQKGKKVDMISKNPEVCFEIHYGAQVLPKKHACSWGTKFRSVIGNGKAELLYNETMKKEALQTIMFQYSGNKNHNFNDKVLAHTSVYRIRMDKLTARQKHWLWDE